MKEKTVTLHPYDPDVIDDVFSVLFYGSDYETEEGLRELPADSYQLVISALDLIAWECNFGSERDTINKAGAILRRLRDKQKLRERARRFENL